MPTPTLKVFIAGPDDTVCKSLFVINNRLVNYFTTNKHSVVQDPRHADILIFNTCGAIDFTETSSLKKLNYLLNIKDTSSKLLVTGCLTKINPTILTKYGKEITILNHLEMLDEIISANHPFAVIPNIATPNYLTSLAIKPPKTYLLFHLNPFKNFLSKLKFPVLKTTLESMLVKNRVLLEISTGCTNSCSYCAIKIAKGELKSIVHQNILLALQLHPNKNTPLSLVAQDCGSYGLDNGSTIYELLSILNRYYPQRKIEISTIYPNWLIKEESLWLKIFQEFNIFEITIPIQSGSSKILKLMNRTYDLNKIVAVLKKIRKLRPQLIIKTHIITGFPGESLLDFLKSLSIMKHFDFILSAKYCDRPSTQSANFPNKIWQPIIYLRWVVLYAYGILISFVRLITGAINR